MIDNELQVRLLHAAKTQDQWKAVTSYPKKGEVCLEAINTSGATAFKIKIGDGTRPYCRNTGTTQEPVWDFTSEYVLPYFGNVISASGDLQVAGYYTYPNDYETVSLHNVTVIRFYQLSLTTTAGEITLSIDLSNYKEVRAGSKLNITHIDDADYGEISHDAITTIISDNSSVVGEKDSDVITSLITDGYGHITAYSKDKSSNMLAADLKGAVEQTDADKTWRYRVTGDTISIKEDTASLNKLDGNTIVWNQQIDVSTLSSSGTFGGINYTYSNGVITAVSGTANAISFSDIALGNIYVKLINGHKYYLGKGGGDLSKYIQIFSSSAGNKDYTTSAAVSSIFTCEYTATDWIIRVRVASGVTVNNDKFTFNVIDLTQMFGETIANSMTVEDFERLFPLPYYAYNEGQLLNVNVNGLKTVGFNQWDEEWELGSYTNIGQKYPRNDAVRSKNMIRILPSTVYYSNYYFSGVCYYDSDGNFLSYVANQNVGVFTTPSNAYYMTFYYLGTTYNHNICINLSDSNRNGTYEPYWSDTTSVPITGITGISSATSLREVIFPDGLKSAGSVKDSIEGGIAYKRLTIRDYASGDESDSSVITDGTHTVVPLTTSITYTNLQYPDGRPFTLPINYRVDDLGTEEWLPEQTASAPISYPVSTITYKSNFKDAVLDTIDKVNNYKNPVQGESGNEPQTVGKVAVYDTTHSTESSDYSVIDSDDTFDPTSDTTIPTVKAIVDYIDEEITVQEIETDDDDNSNPTGLTVTDKGNGTWNVSHQEIDTTASGYNTDDGASIEGEAVVELVTGVNVDSYGHVTGKHTISSDKIIAADIKAPVKKDDNDTWNYRETGGEISVGEDTARIPSLKGNTMVWNQMLNIADFTNTIVDTAAGFIAQFRGVVSGGTQTTLATKYITSPKQVLFLFNSDKDYNEIVFKHGGLTKDIYILNGAAIPLKLSHKYIFSFNAKSVDVTAVGGLVIDNIMMFDLTKLFGSDFAIEKALLGLTTEVAWNNLTADQLALAATNFEKLFPNSYYPYCEGRLVNLGGYDVKWNQLYDTTVPTTETNHKYYLSEVVSSTKTSSISSTISYTSGSTNRMCIDLTMMFGPGSEPTLEEFEAMFPEDYYEYNAGTEMNIFDAIGDKKLGLESTGFNLWDETKTSIGYYNTNTGEFVTGEGNRYILSDWIRVTPGEMYYFSKGLGAGSGGSIGVAYFNANKIWVDGVFTPESANASFTRTIPEDKGIVYMRVSAYDDYYNAYRGKICLNVSDTNKDGTYEPYKSDTLDLDWIREIEYTPSGSSTPEKLFPYGLLSVGSVHDKVTETKAIKRVGVVDISTVNWLYSASDKVFYHDGFNQAATSSSGHKGNILCSKYETKYFNLTSFDFIYLHTNNQLGVRTEAYSDSETFAASLTGIPLYFELANPIEIPLDQPHNMSYVVDDHGTEQQLPINVSSVINAPFVGTFEYISNFKDTVIDLINRVNAYKNPVRGISDTDQTVGKFAIYDSKNTVHSSEYQVKNDPFEGAETAITLPTAEQVIDYVNTQIASSLTYKGVVSGLTGSTSGKIYFSGISNPSSGDLYFLGNLDDSETSMVVDSTASSTYHIAEGTYYPGTMFIWNADTVGSEHWDAIAGTTTVSDGNPILWVDTPVSTDTYNHKKYAVGSIEGNSLHVTVPTIQEIAGKKAAGQVLVGNGTDENDGNATWRGLKLDETVDNSSTSAKISSLGTGVLERYDAGSGNNHDYQWRLIEGNFDANQKLENSQTKITDNTTVSSVPHIYKSENIELNVVKNSSNNNVGFSTYVPLLSKNNSSAEIGKVLAGNYDINSETHNDLPSWRNLKLDELSYDGTNLVPSLGTGFLKRDDSNSWSITNNLLTWKDSPSPFNLTVTTLTTDNTGLLNKIYNYPGVTTIQQLSHTSGLDTEIDGFRVEVPLFTVNSATSGKVLMGNYPSLPSWGNLSMENISEILSQTDGNKGYLKRTATNSGTEQEPNWTYGWELDPYGGGSVMPYKSNSAGTGDVATSSKTTAEINLLPTSGEKILARTALREQVGNDSYIYHKISVGALENDSNIVLVLNGNFS